MTVPAYALLVTIFFVQGLLVFQFPVLAAGIDWGIGLALIVTGLVKAFSVETYRQQR